MIEALKYAGIDPGIYSTTCAIIDGSGKLIAIEQIYTSEDQYPRTVRKNTGKGQRKHDPVGEQIAIDHWDYACKLLRTYEPAAVASEHTLWVPRGSNTEALVGHMRGVINACCIWKDVPFRLVSPNEIKKAAAQSGIADKNQVCQAVWERYGQQLMELDPKCTFPWLKRNNHVADAIGAALFLVAAEMNWLDAETDFSKLEGR